MTRPALGKEQRGQGDCASGAGQGERGGGGGCKSSGGLEPQPVGVQIPALARTAHFTFTYPWVLTAG